MNKTNMRKMLKDLRDAREAATMVNCKLDPDFGRVGSPYTDEVRKNTKIYRYSWIIPQIDNAIELLEKELAK
jgi:uncharacterized protein (UPF0128 family)